MAGWGDAYLAGRKHAPRRLPRHRATLELNLRAPPTTGSECREWVVFHTKSTQVQCSVLHMVTREALLWPQIVTRSSSFLPLRLCLTFEPVDPFVGGRINRMGGREEASKSMERRSDWIGRRSRASTLSAERFQQLFNLCLADVSPINSIYSFFTEKCSHLSL